MARSSDSLPDFDGKLVLLGGSMSGITIIASVARGIIDRLDWYQSPQDALRVGRHLQEVHGAATHAFVQMQTGAQGRPFA